MRTIVASEEELLSLIRLGVRQELEKIGMGGVKEQAPQRAPANRKEVCKYLGISASTLDGLVKSNQIKSFYIGHQVRFMWTDIEDYVNKKG